MSRQRKNASPISNYDLSPFMPQNMLNKFVLFENDSIETLREKLQIKSEALNLLARQLEQCNKEKIEYKQLIDTLYDKNLSLKTALYYKENEVDIGDEIYSDNKQRSSFNSAARKQTKMKTSKSFALSSASTTMFNDIDSEDYMKVLKDLVKVLQKEKHDLIQKYEESQQQLQDSRSDLRLLREQLVRQRIGSVHEGLSTTSSSSFVSQSINGLNMSHDTSSSSMVRESLIREIELLREQKLSLENDLKLFLCQKEELEIERDSYKNKYNKLNDFLIESSLSPCRDIETEYEDPKTIPDKNNNNKLIRKVQISLNVDELLSQNKYLTESNQNLRNELDMLKNSMKKLKASASGARTPQSQFNPSSSIDFIQSNDSSKINILNKKKMINLLNRAEQFIQEQTSVPLAVELISELKCLIESLLENLNDKLTANLHQRKVNKMLANRIQDLEKQINAYLKPKLNKQDVMLTFDNNIKTIMDNNENETSSSDGMERPIMPEIIKNKEQNSSQFNPIDTKINFSSTSDVNLNDSISLIRFEDDYNNSSGNK